MSKLEELQIELIAAESSGDDAEARHLRNRIQELRDQQRMSPLFACVEEGVWPSRVITK